MLSPELTFWTSLPRYKYWSEADLAIYLILRVSIPIVILGVVLSRLIKKFYLSLNLRQCHHEFCQSAFMKVLSFLEFKTFFFTSLSLHRGPRFKTREKLAPHPQSISRPLPLSLQLFLTPLLCFLQRHLLRWQLQVMLVSANRSSAYYERVGRECKRERDTGKYWKMNGWEVWC